MMKEYVVSKGQNIYDVALHLYGSIEGMPDLFFNNPDFSLEKPLTVGDVLFYSEDFVIDEQVVAYNKMHGLIPANGERHVYYKESTLPLLAILFINNEIRSAQFTVSGTGTLEVDWGDNSDLQVINLTDECQDFLHYFDNAVAESRKIKIYGKASFEIVDLSGMVLSELRLTQPLEIRQFRLIGAEIPLTFMPLLTGTYRMTLPLLKCENLQPLVELKDLIEVDLSKGRFMRSVLDAYLIRLVTHHGNRRSCTLLLSNYPSGQYMEPDKDENNRYIITSGMEAVWILTHEPAWNEAGYWKVVINDQIYTAEK